MPQHSKRAVALACGSRERKFRIMKPFWKPDCGQNILLCFVLHQTIRPRECPFQHARCHRLRSASQHLPPLPRGGPYKASCPSTAPSLPTCCSWARRGLTALLGLPSHLHRGALWASAIRRDLNREKNEGGQCPLGARQKYLIQK